ncbi:asparagine synthase-related protein [Caulobacter segnis]
MKSEDFSEVLDINKYLLRRLADEMLPPAIARRKKLGLSTPLDTVAGRPTPSTRAGNPARSRDPTTRPVQD